ncbi:unnamed protein product [Closterium sp. NIES-64]|nr:unnamed protein product [Closterium sp. NIES-64]
MTVGHLDVDLRRDPLHSADPDGHQSPPSADAGGIARGAQNPIVAQENPSPASPEIDAESAARGIALAVSAGLPNLGEIGDGESGGSQATADRQLRGGEARVDQESDAEGNVAAGAGAAAIAHAHEAAVQPDDSTQRGPAPTNTQESLGVRSPDEVETARAPDTARAQTRMDAQERGDGGQRAPEDGGPRCPPYSLARGRDPRRGPSRPNEPPRTPAGRQRRGLGTALAPQPTRNIAAAASAQHGIRVGRGGSRGGRRGGAVVQRRGASSFSRAAHRILRGRARDGEESSDENSVGDPLFNPEREGSPSPSPELEEAEQARDVDRTPTPSRAASAIRIGRQC